jgi:hypothetical protein
VSGEGDREEEDPDKGGTSNTGGMVEEDKRLSSLEERLVFI